MIKKDFHIALVLFFTLFFLTSLLALFTSYKYWDETIYANLGRNMVLYHEYSFLHGFSDFYPKLPLAGSRPPMLPLIVAFISLFSFNSFLLNFIVPLISAFGVVFLFLFCKKLFNREIAFFSALLLMLLPSFFFWSSKLLHDAIVITYLIIASYFFFDAFIFDNTNKKAIVSSLLFGFFIAISFLTRYNVPWIFPVFFLVLLIKYKNFSFLRDKKIWLSILTFAIVTVPWFVFNYLNYHSLFGFLESSAKASVRWGARTIFFYFGTLMRDYWFLLPFFVFGLFVNFRLKAAKSNKYFFMLWFFIIFIAASLTPAKEDRYLIMIAPSLCVISAFTFYYLRRKAKVLFYITLSLLLIIMLFAVANYFQKAQLQNISDEQKCFFSAMEYIKNSNTAAVVTEHFSPVYFYTQVPNIRVNNYTIIESLIKGEYKRKEVLYFYASGDWFNLKSEKPDLNLLYSCDKYNIFNISNQNNLL